MRQAASDMRRSTACDFTRQPRAARGRPNIPTHQVPRTPCIVGPSFGGRNSGKSPLRARVTGRTPTLEASESSDQRSIHVLLPPVDKRRRLAPRQIGGETATQNDTDSSAQPTLWGEVPQLRAPGARSRGVCAGTKRLRKSASCGRLTRSPTTSAFRSRPSTAGERADTGRPASVSATTCAGAHRR